MKHLEDLARYRVNEALRNGIKSQHIHRSLANKDKPSQNTAGELTAAGQTSLPGKRFAFALLRTALLKVFGLFGF